MDKLEFDGESIILEKIIRGEKSDEQNLMRAKQVLSVLVSRILDEDHSYYRKNYFKKDTTTTFQRHSTPALRTKQDVLVQNEHS